MFLFLHKVPATSRVIPAAVFVALILLPSASAQQEWGISEGAIVSSDEHKFSVRTSQLSFKWCPYCPTFKEGEIVEFLTNSYTSITFQQYKIRPAQVSNFRRLNSLLFLIQGKALVAEDLSLEDPKPGVIEALEMNAPRPQPSPLAAGLASQEHEKNGLALQNRGDLDGAIREYRESIKLDPRFAKPHNNLGNALRSQGDHDGALREYEVALRLDPSYKIAHYNLAIELNQRGLEKQAAAHYKAACPDYASTYCPAAPQGLSFAEQCAKDIYRCNLLIYGPHMACTITLKARGCLDALFQPIYK
jgi:tetratricopeptide (TPR) repeat protein